MIKTINDSLEKLAEDKKFDEKILNNRVNSIKNFIKKQLSRNPEFEYIGSYRHKTGVKLSDEKYDIDVSLIFNDLNDETIKPLKKELHKILNEYRDNLKDKPSVRWRNYAIAIDFASDNSGRNYHFDFTIYNKNKNVVKGKQDEEMIMEETGTFDFINNIENFKYDQKRIFQTLTILLKHWNKNGKYYSNGLVPSIVFTDEVLSYVENKWNGSNDFLSALLKIIESIIKKGPNNWFFSQKPHDNPFDRKNVNTNKALFEKMDKFREMLIKVISETNSNIKYDTLIKYLPGLTKPKDDRNESDIKGARISKNKGAK